MKALSWVLDLGKRGDAAALVDSRGATLTYAELSAQVSERVELVGSQRGLVAIDMTTDTDAIVWYLATLAAGSVAMPLEADNATQQTLLDAYRPDAVVQRAGNGRSRFLRLADPAARGLHPDLALVLSTSGSTGSPKLVRLSHENLSSNASAIADYLALTPDDRAALTLPLHYCYGLSVLHSHLHAGASVVTNEYSVVDSCFWSLFDRTRATSFAGVPFTFELLERVGFLDMELPSLRYVTQAGGPMQTERVLRFGAAAARAGWKLFVMYGQTEATARMSYVPPELLLSHPHTIGRPIPGGSFELAYSDDLEPGVGELVYHGPNVMLGYAESAEDLVLGRTVDQLHTGDHARYVEGGMYEIVGRANRFLKLFGKRVDLGRVEQLLAADGVSAVCSGSDDHLVVAVTTDTTSGATKEAFDAQRIASSLEDRLELPRHAIRVIALDELPRTRSGKIDYRAIATLAEEHHVSLRPKSVRSLYRTIFQLDDVPDHATFVDLGGDSLSYVEASIALEEMLGHPPTSWHTRTVAELDALPTHRSRVSWMETNVALRALAICAVVSNHFGFVHIFGGADILLLIAGYNFARFYLSGGMRAGAPGPMILTLARVAIPAWAVMLLSSSWTKERALFVRSYTLPHRQGIDGYWFIDVLVHVLLVSAALMSITPLRRWVVAHPFRAAMLATAGALMVRAAWAGIFGREELLTAATHMVVWLFVFGWAVLYCTTTRRRVVASLVAFVGLLGLFEAAWLHEFVLVGALALIWIPAVPVLRPLNRVVGWIAGASLYIYLTHWLVTERLQHGSPFVRTVVAIVTGVVIWTAVQAVSRSLGPRMRRRFAR